MSGNAYQMDLPKIIEHLRVLVRRSNKQELVQKVGVPYTRLIYFARSANSTPNPEDLTALMKYYMPGYVFVVPETLTAKTDALPQDVGSHGVSAPVAVAA